MKDLPQAAAVRSVPAGTARQAWFPADNRTVDTVRALCHDLRQPLAAILMLSDGDPAEGTRGMAMIHDQARWLAEMVEAVLGDAAQDGPQTVEVTAVIERCVVRARQTSPAQLRYRGSGEARTATRAVALGRAVSALIDNAVRAAGDDGHVDVSVERTPTSVTIAVTDDGPGLGYVPPQHSLGLAIARALVCSCGGQLTVVAGTPAGVEARIVLPLAGELPRRQVSHGLRRFAPRAS